MGQIKESYQLIDGNENPIPGLMNDSWTVTHSHTTAALASKAAVANTKHVLKDIIFYSDKATAVVLVKVGTTTVLTWKPTAAGWGHVPLAGNVVTGANQLVSVGIDGTAVCIANMVGYSIKEE